MSPIVREHAFRACMRRERVGYTEVSCAQGSSISDRVLRQEVFRQVEDVHGRERRTRRASIEPDDHLHAAMPGACSDKQSEWRSNRGSMCYVDWATRVVDRDVA